jgi:hypothetical protein
MEQQLVLDWHLPLAIKHAGKLGGRFAVST